MPGTTKRGMPPQGMPPQGRGTVFNLRLRRAGAPGHNTTGLAPSGARGTARPATTQPQPAKHGTGHPEPSPHRGAPAKRAG
ncbi:hypothetical protein GCM10009801_43290 [Streptomyces albiaxialis]|uniref:Uncharacterized protein n=1 Tax=Streptomyces albiaxialis TaxID=329523 RepID=A0ABP5HNG0_9ACTN